MVSTWQISKWLWDKDSKVTKQSKNTGHDNGTITMKHNKQWAWKRPWKDAGILQNQRTTKYLLVSTFSTLVLHELASCPCNWWIISDLFKMITWELHEQWPVVASSSNLHIMFKSENDAVQLTLYRHTNGRWKAFGTSSWTALTNYSQQPLCELWTTGTRRRHLQE